MIVGYGYVEVPLSIRFLFCPQAESFRRGYRKIASRAKHLKLHRLSINTATMAGWFLKPGTPFNIIQVMCHVEMGGQVVRFQAFRYRIIILYSVYIYIHIIHTYTHTYIYIILYICIYI